jgi:Derlin-2/3
VDAQFHWAVLAPYISILVMCFVQSYLSRLQLLTQRKATAGGFLNSYTFLPALTLSYAYTFAQDNPTRQVSFFIVNFDAKFLPFALLFMTFIIDGPEPAAAQLTGLLAAHMYDFLTRIWPTFGGGKNYIHTPNFVKRLFGGTVGVQNRGFGYVVQGQGRASGSGAGAPAAAAAGVTNRWGSVGPGRRLGGE